MNVEVHPVDYAAVPESAADPATLVTRCATTKRPMYDYEREARALAKMNDHHKAKLVGRLIAPDGVPVTCDLENTIQAVIIHPEAHEMFRRTVLATVKHYAPALGERIKWSAMRPKAPLRRTTIAEISRGSR
jgi:hypothetical protein